MFCSLNVGVLTGVQFLEDVCVLKDVLFRGDRRSVLTGVPLLRDGCVLVV